MTKSGGSAPAGGAARAASITVLVSAYIVAAILLLALLAALAVPIHAIDALSYGEWSRLIADHGGLRFGDISAQTYHRPLYYVLQGWLWDATGFSETSGRLLALSFSLVLVAAVAWLAARGRPFALKGTLGALSLVLVPDFTRGVVSGLTDVPLAAIVALTACVLWSERLDRARIPLLVLCAAAAALTKPTALVALVTLCAAHLLGSCEGVRQRVLTGVLPVAGGAALALVYHAIQASYIGSSLLEFLRAGSTGFYADLAAEERADAVFGFAWLGPELRPLLLFALLYALTRTAGVVHAHAALGAAPIAMVLSVLGGVLPSGDAASSAAGSLWHVVGLIVLGGALAAAALAPPEYVPSRLWLARFLVFGLPVLAVWAWGGAYDTRLSSAAWPALLALCGLVAAAAVAGAARLHPAAVVAPVAVLVALALGNATTVDDLGDDRWRELRGLGGDMFDHDRTREIVMPALSDQLALIRPELGSEGRLHSAEGQFRFFFPGRARQDYAMSCADLRGYRFFVLLTDEGTKAYMHGIGVPAEPSYWAACTAPRLTQLSDGSEGYATFRIEQ